MREPHEPDSASYKAAEKLPEGPYPRANRIREAMLPYWLIGWIRMPALCKANQTSSCADLAGANVPRCARLPDFASVTDPFDGNLLDPYLKTKTEKDKKRIAPETMRISIPVRCSA